MKSSWRLSTIALSATAALTATTLVAASEPLPVETLVVAPPIKTSGLVYASNGDRIMVGDAGTFKWLTTLAIPGWRGQFMLSGTDQVIITYSWWERGTTGKRTDLVEVWDVATGSSTGVSIEVPPRLALRGNDRTTLGLSGDGKWLFLQNATPATSVSVVDMVGKKFASEIPIPGCFGIYPVMGSGNRFATLCGDGQVATVTVDARGKSTGIERSGPIFDSDKDPLIPAYVRDGDQIFFASYNGSIYQIDVSGPAAKLTTSYSIVEGVEGGWKPSGEQMLAWVPEAKVMYVLMFPNSKDGDHRSPAKEVWAVDVTTKKVLSRSTINPAMGMIYAALPSPALIMNDTAAGAMVRYAVDPEAGYSVRFDRKIDLRTSQRIEAR